VTKEPGKSPGTSQKARFPGLPIFVTAVRRGFRSPIRARSREFESKEESDLLWTQESESKEESDLLWTQESESKEESDLLWTQESESKEESDLLWARESESKEESDLAGHLLSLDL
jgi:hypothetical protein